MGGVIHYPGRIGDPAVVVEAAEELVELQTQHLDSHLPRTMTTGLRPEPASIRITIMSPTWVMAYAPTRMKDRVLVR